jgi:hypothetical protein
MARGLAAASVEGLSRSTGGATVDELSDVDGLHTTIRDVGFDILHESLASERDWASYEEFSAPESLRAAQPAPQWNVGTGSLTSQPDELRRVLSHRPACSSG